MHVHVASSTGTYFQYYAECNVPSTATIKLQTMYRPKIGMCRYIHALHVYTCSYNWFLTWGVGHVKRVEALTSPDMSSPTVTTWTHLVKSKNIRKGLSLCTDTAYILFMLQYIPLPLSLSVSHTHTYTNTYTHTNTNIRAHIYSRHICMDSTESSFGVSWVDNPPGFPFHPC